MNLVSDGLPALVFGLTTVLLLLMVYVPALSAFFGTQPLNLVDLSHLHRLQPVVVCLSGG